MKAFVTNPVVFQVLSDLIVQFVMENEKLNFKCFVIQIAGKPGGHHFSAPDPHGLGNEG